MYSMLIIINCLLLHILCIDIDECLSGPCPSHTICNNNDGNYTCDCPDGTIMNGTDCVCKNTAIKLNFVDHLFCGFLNLHISIDSFIDLLF